MVLRGGFPKRRMEVVGSGAGRDLQSDDADDKHQHVDGEDVRDA